MASAVSFLCISVICNAVEAPDSTGIFKRLKNTRSRTALIKENMELSRLVDSLTAEIDRFQSELSQRDSITAEIIGFYEEEDDFDFIGSRSDDRAEEPKGRGADMPDLGDIPTKKNKVVNIAATTQLQVVLVKPERFEDASSIADHINDRRTVVLNLEGASKEVSRRLIDFLSGVAYANEGQIKRVAAALKKGGIFLFDVSSEYKLRRVIGDNVFCEDCEDVAYMWFNHLFEDRVEMDVTVFAKQKDGRFERSDERHVQYIHTEASLVGAAEKAGFSCLKTEGAFGDVSDKTRINFILRRN